MAAKNDQGHVQKIIYTSNMSRKLSIGIISAFDLNDRRHWSGTSYKMFKTLQKVCEKVVLLGPVHLPIALILFMYIKDVFFRIIYRKKYLRHHNILISNYYARKFKKKLIQFKLDILFAPVASAEIAFLDTDLPICYLSDTSFSQIRKDGYTYDGIASRSLFESEQIEKRAINRANVLVYPGAWAADHVISHYRVNPKNVHIVKLGANMDDPPDKPYMNKTVGSQINLLFLGVDWERKGGDIALAGLKDLLARRHDVTLIVCGCIPPVSHPKMRTIPFLNKNTESDRLMLHKVLSESHILFLPTRADCFPIVFCEAAAYGLPAVATNIGGVSSLIEHKKTGFLLPENSSPADYADSIEQLINNPDMYRTLSSNAREKYEMELNWGVWGNQMNKILKETHIRSLDKTIS